jgi:hypothetical protein
MTNDFATLNRSKVPGAFGKASQQDVWIWNQQRGCRIKALSTKQPWVHAILCEGKDTENRSWQCSHRGWIALHASAKPLHGHTFPGRLKTPDFDTLDYSAICGIARLVNIVTKSRFKWFTQPSRGYINYGWVLADIARNTIPPNDGMFKMDSRAVIRCRRNGSTSLPRHTKL